MRVCMYACVHVQGVSLVAANHLTTVQLQVLPALSVCVCICVCACMRVCARARSVLSSCKSLLTTAQLQVLPALKALASRCAPTPARQRDSVGENSSRVNPQRHKGLRLELVGVDLQVSRKSTQLVVCRIYIFEVFGSRVLYDRSTKACGGSLWAWICRWAFLHGGRAQSNVFWGKCKRRRLKLRQG